MFYNKYYMFKCLQAKDYLLTKIKQVNSIE